LRLGYFIISSFVVLALTFAAPAAADKPSDGNDGVRAGGLMCVSITPPKSGGSSCDTLCGAKGTVCVGLKMNGAINPGIGCGDVLNPLKGGSVVAACRCCAITR
jgi:hypothetical protein